jgi:hypothetical protein
MKNLFYYVLLASGFIAGFITYDSLEYASTGEWLSPFHALVACLLTVVAKKKGMTLGLGNYQKIRIVIESL